MRNYSIFWILVTVMFSSCGLFRAGMKAPINQNAENYLAQGKRLLSSEDFPEAMDAFELAIGEDYHRSQTAAVYLSGLAAYFAEFDNVARERFETIVYEYPKSNYLEEAQYHLALMNLRQRNMTDKEEGIQELLEISTKSKQSDLKTDALEQVKKAFFTSFTIEQLRGLKNRIKTKGKPLLQDALVFKLIQSGDWNEAQKEYNNYRLAGGKASDYLTSIMEREDLDEAVATLFEPDIIRIALFLPVYLDENQFLNQLPSKMKIGMEFYEGFQMAIDEFESGSSKKVFLKIFDTQRDTGLTRILTAALDSIVPNLIVGDIYNSQSRIISEWAESRGIPMVVPLSPSADLIESKQYTFLGHPSSDIHGRRMADYAWNDLELKHVYMFSDQADGTRALSETFSDQFIGFGGIIDTLIFSRDYELALKQIPKLVGEIEDDSAGVYIPVMGNEEAAGLIINVLKQRGKLLPVMGSPHFRSRYNAIPRDVKESYELLFSTAHLFDPNSLEYRRFYQDYLKYYYIPPTERVIQGYDLGSYLLEKMDQFDPAMGYTFDTYLRVAPASSTIHIDYHFNGTQSNQSVNIGQYTLDGVRKVN